MKRSMTRTAAGVMFALLFSATVQAEIAIVVNSSVGLSQITTDVASDIFLGKLDALPDGTRMVPIDQEDGQAARTEFYSKVVKKDAAQLNAYWSRLIFTGKGEPPKKVADNAEVIALVKSNPNIIGYVDGAAVNSSVKVLLRVP